jgi:transcriptional regulator with XRE-family HTH domain
VPEHGSPSVRRRRLAAELRRLRERADFIGEEVAERLSWSTSKLSRIETGKSGIKPEDLRLLLGLYRVAEPHLSALLALAHESTKTASVDDAAISSFRPGYGEFVYAEAEAIALWNWEPQVIPGLLQTESYAREVMRGWYSMFNLPPAELEIQVEARMKRKQVLAREEPQPLDLSAVIDESVIRRRFGENSVMRQQLEWLAESSDMPNVEVRVLLLGGTHPVGTLPFTYMQFSRELKVPQPDIVYVEQLDNNLYIEDVAETNKYRVTFERLKATALNPAESRELILNTARQIWS